MTDTDGPDFPYYLRAHLDRRGWEVSNLARESGISESVIFRWVRGSNRPNVDNARAIADILDVPLLEMLVAAGLLTPEEARASVARPPSVADLTDTELIDEVRRRMEKGRDA